LAKNIWQFFAKVPNGRAEHLQDDLCASSLKQATGRASDTGEQTTTLEKRPGNAVKSIRIDWANPFTPSAGHKILLR
jgi:hypothetical protein